MSFLREVTRHGERNGLTPQAAAAIFSPVLMWTGDGSGTAPQQRARSSGQPSAFESVLVHFLTAPAGSA
jgi:hypothetical protein